MKKLFTSIILAAFLLFSNAYSQGTIKLTFMANHDGEYIALDSIFVENLTRPGTMTLYHPDTILFLTPNNGISDYNKNDNVLYLSQNYPNPFDNETTIQLLLSKNQNTIFRIYNFQGQELAHHEYMLCAGLHSFTFYPGKEKNYLFSVSTSHGIRAIKLINTGNNNGSCDLVYYEYMPMKTESKSIKTPFPFIIGDQLKYTGYATPCNNLAGSGFLNHTPTIDDYMLFNISSPAHTIPTLITIPADSVTATTAISGGNISSDGCYAVTARGICWGSLVNPDITDSHIQSGAGIGPFPIHISDLTPNNTYYIRAYATNSAGTAYGNNVSITTLNATLPTIITTAISSITGDSAVSGGDITNDGGAPIISRGVCYGTSQNPTLNDLHTSNGTGPGIFISSLTGLTLGTRYYVRAYASNIIGTSYGAQLSFTTIDTPFLTTDTISNIGTTTAIGGGNITSDGGSIITERGLCWSTSQNPTVNNLHTSDGVNIGLFTSNLTGLSLGTLYYVRAYATNIAGTSYGNELSFTTLALIPTLTTNDFSSITVTSAITGGNITNDGGATVIERGVCWDTLTEPTIANNHTSDGIGIGSFFSNITGLSIYQTYYARAYATNSIGTAYGNEISLTTTIPNCGTVTDVDGNIYNTVTIGAQCWMRENLKTTKYRDNIAIPNVTDNTTWGNLTTGAYCNYNNSGPNANIYGRLYNWYAINTHNVCPTGWHVPTDAQWTTLRTYLGGIGIAGAKLKETDTTHWYSPNTGATNESGYTALPGGYRSSDGTFYNIRAQGLWWSSTILVGTAYYWYISYNSDHIERTDNDFKKGFSVRCLRDF